MRIAIGLVLLLSSSFVQSHELLSDKAIKAQCIFYSSALTTTYATIRANPDVQISPAEIAEGFLVTVMTDSTMYDWNTKLFMGFLPIDHAAAYTAEGVKAGYGYAYTENFDKLFDALADTIPEQLAVLADVSMEDCVSRLTNHREQDHNGEENPAPPKQQKEETKT